MMVPDNVTCLEHVHRPSIGHNPFVCTHTGHANEGVTFYSIISRITMLTQLKEFCSGLFLKFTRCQEECTDTKFVHGKSVTS